VAHEALLKVVADSKKVASRPLSRTQKTSERLRRLQDMSSLATDKMTRKFRMVVTPTIGLSPSVLDALSKVYEVDVEMITTVPECVPVATARLSWKDQSSSNDGASKKKKKKVAAASTTLPSNLITGPELAIFDQANNTKQILKPGEIGSIFIRGSPCFQGYSYDHVIGSQFSLLPFRSTDWFDTDLVGCLEVDGRIRIVQEPGDAKEYNSS